MARVEGRYFTGSMTDKRFEADGMAEYCRRFLSSGVWELGDNLRVTSGEGLSVNIGYGAALVDGYPFQIKDNGTGVLILQLDEADALPRIDRVVVRKDTAAQRVYPYIKKGLPATSPAAPSLERINGVFEVSLARVSVAVGAAAVSTGNITDERADFSVCGLAYYKKYDVGDIYISADPTSPAIKFGGVWTRIKDKFILGAGDTYANGATGGTATVTLVANNIPPLSIPIPYRGTTPAAGYAAYQLAPSTEGITGLTANPNSSNAPVDKMPPWAGKFIWERTA